MNVETIKTTVVVASLLGVLYGVYTILNKEPAAPPPAVAQAFEEGGMPELHLEGPGFEETDMSFAADSPDLEVPGIEGYPSPTDSVTPPSSPGESFMAPVPPTLDAAGDDVASADMGSSPPLPPSLPDESDTADNSPPSLGPENEPVPPVPPASPVSPTPEGPGISPPPATGDFAAENPAIQPPPLGSDSFDSGSVAAAEPAPPLIADNSPSPGASAAPPAVAEPSPPAAEPSLRPFQRAQRTAKAQIDGGQYRQALFTLSLFYNDSDLTEQERAELLDLLDPLAGRVIYSREHLLTSAHVTTQGETIESIAAKYRVPAQLLININGIQRPDAMTSGMELKVVPGPFRAEVDTKRGELTLFLERMYAGRFPISVGNDPTPRAGQYTVKDKRPGQTYYGEGGTSIPAGAPTNPYGGHWLDLGGLSIHGSSQQPTEVSRGCISLSPRDAADVYHILSVGSDVTVQAAAGSSGGQQPAVSQQDTDATRG